MVHGPRGGCRERGIALGGAERDLVDGLPGPVGVACGLQVVVDGEQTPVVGRGDRGCLSRYGRRRKLPYRSLTDEIICNEVLRLQFKAVTVF